MSTPGNKKAEEITEQEKYIYNTYLRVHRSSQNKPFKYRKNFTDFKENESYVFIKRLGTFFKKFNHINIQSFFDAPYKLYPDDDSIYDLKFYSSPRAIKVYSLYMKHLDQSDPDNNYHITFVKDSLMYIFKFCRDQRIQLNEYIKHKTGDIPTFILHLRDRYISIYSLFEFDDFEKMLYNIPDERLNFTIGENFISSLANYRSRYYTSIKNKQITKEGIYKIQKLLLTANG